MNFRNNRSIEQVKNDLERIVNDAHLNWVETQPDSCIGRNITELAYFTAFHGPADDTGFISFHLALDLDLAFADEDLDYSYYDHMEPLLRQKFVQYFQDLLIDPTGKRNLTWVHHDLDEAQIYKTEGCGYLITINGTDQGFLFTYQEGLC